MLATAPGRPDLATALGEFPVFAGMPAQAMATLTAGAVVESLADGATIFSQDDEADAVYAILRGEGRVRVGAPAADAKRLMVEVFKELEIFGEIAVIDRGLRSADATADGPVRIARLRASQFREVMATTPALGVNLVKLLAARLRRTFALFQDASFETLDVRLARQLLYLARVGSRKVEVGSRWGVRLAGRFRQGDLANLLGATTRSIITILNDWRGRGVLAYDAERGFITVIDEAFFRRLVAPGEDEEPAPKRP